MIVILLFSVHLMIPSCLFAFSFCVPLHTSAFLFVPLSVSYHSTWIIWTVHGTVLKQPSLRQIFLLVTKY